MQVDAASFHSRLRFSLVRLFRRREIIIRSEGRVHCLTLEPQHQAGLAGGFVAGLGLVVWAFAGLILDQIAGPEIEPRLQQTKAAYAELVGEMETSYRQLAELATRAAAGEASDESAAMGAVTRDAEGLKSRLVAFEDRLYDLISLNRNLNANLTVLRQRLLAEESQNQTLRAEANSRQNELDGIRLAFSSVAGDRDQLLKRLGGMESTLTMAERNNRALMAAAQAAFEAPESGGTGPAATMVGYPLRKLFSGRGPEDALVLAVMKQESAFNPLAVSRAGARGLMQLMPTTARGLAKKLKLDYSSSKLQLNADFNIALGRAYLEELLDLFDGSYVLAIASYNAGPNRVLEWMRRFGDPRDAQVDAAAWVAAIPFTETRTYVRRVLKSLDMYRDSLTTASSQRCFSLENVSW
jgi:soluble lytic murein transglycosylase-like protein